MDERRQSQRSRRRASRILAEKRRRGAALSCDDESPARERAKPPRRKKKEPLYEEDVVDGFAILSFKTFEDIETCLKLGKGATNGVIPTITRDEPAAVKQERASPVPPKIVNNHHEKAAHDVGTSDDSCREKEKRIIKRDPESEDNRLSDASSRCSSGRGYICDSEGDDDKKRLKNRLEPNVSASDSGSVLFSASPPPTRNHESKPADVQIVNGHTPTIKTNGSPRPETPPPPPPPVQAVQPIQQQQQPPPQPQPPPPQQPPQQPVTSSNHFPAMPNGVPKVERVSPPPVHVSSPRIIPPPSSTYTTRPGVGYVGYPPPPPQPTICHPTTATSQPLPYQPPLYAPYNNTPYLPPSHQLARRSPVGLKPITTSVGPVMPTTTTSSHRDMVNTPLVGRSHSPRGHSPTRERDSYSSNVSSLSRGSVGTPGSIPPYTAPHHPPQSSLPYNKPSIWVSSNTGPQVSPAASSRLGFPHPFPPPMFPPTQVAPSQPPPAPAPPPNPFSAESLFQSSKSSSIPDQGDLLRRELDSRFLASQDRGPYIRTEMHHHQHQHTHVHQHTTPIIPPPPPTLFTSPIFKDIPKGAAVESPFYRQSIGFTGYPGYSPGLMHPTFGPSTPFAPPTHIPTFTPKQLTEPSKPKTVKTGKWNAMHVRVAWEIYHHQQKGGLSMGGESKVGTLIGKSDLLRPPTHMFGPPHPFTPAHRAPPTFEHTPPTFPPMGTSVFGRYPAATATFPSLPAFPPPGSMHDPWARLQPRPVPTQGFPPTNPWTLKPDPHEEREREKERERSRERARREEKQRRLVSVSKVRDRSPLRAEPQVVPASSKDDEVAMLSRQQHFLTRQPPRPLPPHFPASPWDPYRYDTLRYNPLVAALREEEEQRAKLFGTYPGAPPSVAHLRPKATSPPHRLPPAHQPKEESSQSR